MLLSKEEFMKIKKELVEGKEKRTFFCNLIMLLCVKCIRWICWQGSQESSILHSTTLHYTTLHYTTLHYTTLHYTIIRYTILRYTTLHYTTLHYTTLHYTTLHYTTLHYTTLHYTTLYYTTLHYTTLHLLSSYAIYYISSHYLTILLKREREHYIVKRIWSTRAHQYNAYEKQWSWLCYVLRIILLDVLVRLRLLARLEAELLFREYKNYPGVFVFNLLLLSLYLLFSLGFPCMSVRRSFRTPHDYLIKCPILSYRILSIWPYLIHLTVSYRILSIWPYLTVS